MASIEQAKQRLLEALGPAGAPYYPHYLEKHLPHVLENIAACWGTAKIDDCFKELMVTGRPGRQGFPPEAADEILHLFCLYSGQPPSRPMAKTDATGWDWLESVEYFEKHKSA